MGRAPCCDKANVKKGPWSPEEDAKLKDYIQKNGTGGNWIALPTKAGLRRCGKSCRLRWLNYLRPDIKHGEFSVEEDRIICTLYASIGSRWSIIAAQLPGRTDNDIKNYWNTKLKKKLAALLNPQPHQRKTQSLLLPNSYQNSPSPTSQLLLPSMSMDYTCNLDKPFPSLDFTSTPFLFSNDTSFFPVQEGHFLLKDSHHIGMSMGSEGSCRSSDGSFGREIVIKQEEMGLQSYLSSGYANQWSESSTNGYLGENDVIDYGMKSFRELLGECNLDFNCSMSIAETKTEGKAMPMYYF